MRNRPAILGLLAAALCVPAGFAQDSTTNTKKSPATPHEQSPASRKSRASRAAKSSRRSRRQPGQKTPTKDRVSEIQTALAKDGSFSGAPTGKWDDETTLAMRKFQSAHGLNATGKLDAPSLQKLGLGSQTAGVAAPTPPPGAVSRLASSSTAPAPQYESSPRR